MKKYIILGALAGCLLGGGLYNLLLYRVYDAVSASEGDPGLLAQILQRSFYGILILAVLGGVIGYFLYKRQIRIRK